MVKLRFARQGRTHRAFFRLAAYDVRTRRNGTVIESLGWFNPQPGRSAKDMEINVERVKHWLEHGAQPTESVRDMLGKMELLPPRMKAEWEADRKAARDRVGCKVSLKKAEAASTELAAFAGKAKHPEAVNPFVAVASEALKGAKLAVSKADVALAESSAAAAEHALAQAKAAEEAASAKAAEPGSPSA